MITREWAGKLIAAIENEEMKKDGLLEWDSGILVFACDSEADKNRSRNMMPLGNFDHEGKE